MLKSYWMIGAVLVSLVATSPLSADEDHTLGRIMGYAEIVNGVSDLEDPNLVLLQTLIRDLDTAGQEMEHTVKEMSDRAFRDLVDTLEDGELRGRVRAMETGPAREAVIKAIHQDLLGKKMALHDRLTELSPEEVRHAINDLLTMLQAPESGQAFAQEIGTAVGRFFGKVGGFILGHGIFVTASSATVVAAGPFLVAVKILSTAGKGVYIGFQYTREFRVALRAGTRAGWKAVRARLEGELEGLAD